MPEYPFNFGGDVSTQAFRGVYRDNVAVMVLRHDGRLMFCKCADDDHEWQFPQGGVDAGETRREAMFRELREETGIRPTAVRVTAVRSGYQYTFPNGRLKKGVFCGQRQTFFLCALIKPDCEINLNAVVPPEFEEIEWVLPAEFPIERTPTFKHVVYRQVMEDFFQVTLP